MKINQNDFVILNKSDILHNNKNKNINLEDLRWFHLSTSQYEDYKFASLYCVADNDEVIILKHRYVLPTKFQSKTFFTKSEIEYIINKIQDEQNS